MVLAAGSKLKLDIDGTGTGAGAGNYSRLLVSSANGSFTAGGTLQPVLRDITGDASNSFVPAIGQQFTVVAAQGGVQGSCAGLLQPSGRPTGTRFDALYAPSTVTLVVTPAAYGNLGLAGLPQTANQSAVGQALDAIRPAAGPPLGGAASALFTPLYSLPGQAIAQALEQLSPSLYGDIMLSARMATTALPNRWCSGWPAGAPAGRAAGQHQQRRRVRPGRSGALPSSGCGAQHGVVAAGTTAWFPGVGQWAQVALGAAGLPDFACRRNGVDLTRTLAPGLVGGFAVGGGSANTFSWRWRHGAGIGAAGRALWRIQRRTAVPRRQVAYVRFDQTTTRPLGAWTAWPATA